MSDEGIGSKIYFLNEVIKGLRTRCDLHVAELATKDVEIARLRVEVLHLNGLLEKIDGHARIEGLEARP